MYLPAALPVVHWLKARSIIIFNFRLLILFDDNFSQVQAVLRDAHHLLMTVLSHYSDKRTTKHLQVARGGLSYSTTLLATRYAD